MAEPASYLRCRCGYREEGVCGVFYGWTCPECGGVDTARIIVRRQRRDFDGG
jgi:hypothetical protein